MAKPCMPSGDPCFCQFAAQFNSGAHNPFGMTHHGHHHHHTHPGVEYPTVPGSAILASDYYEYCREFRQSLSNLITERGIPRNICPQNGFIQHTVGGTPFYIDVLSFNLITAQNLPEHIFVPARKPIKDNPNALEFAVLRLPRPKCEALIISFDAYKVQYFTTVQQVFESADAWELPDWNPDLLQNQVEMLMNNEFCRFLAKITSNTSLISVDDVDWVKLW